MVRAETLCNSTSYSVAPAFQNLPIVTGVTNTFTVQLTRSCDFQVAMFPLELFEGASPTLPLEVNVSSPLDNDFLVLGSHATTFAVNITVNVG